MGIRIVIREVRRTGQLFQRTQQETQRDAKWVAIHPETRGIASILPRGIRSVRASRVIMRLTARPIRAGIAGGMVGSARFAFSSSLGLAEMTAGNLKAAEAAVLAGIRAVSKTPH
jgi:hypothetical protein